MLSLQSASLLLLLAAASNVLVPEVLPEDLVSSIIVMLEGSKVR